MLNVLITFYSDKRTEPRVSNYKDEFQMIIENFDLGAWRPSESLPIHLE
jgi:hypothetical protein